MSSLQEFSPANLAERHCPFYVRGRCKRDKCEFKHDPTELKAAKAELVAKAKHSVNTGQATYESKYVYDPSAS